MINICIYEDDQYQELLPLTFARPVYDQLVGFSTIFTKLKSFFGYGNITLHCRDYLTPITKNKYPDLAVNKINAATPCLFINGRLVIDEKIFSEITAQDDGHNLLFTKMGQVIALYLHGEQITNMKTLLEKVPTNVEIIEYFRPKCIAKELEDGIIISKLWDYLTYNNQVIRLDFIKQSKPGIIQGNIKPMAALYNENNIYIGKNTNIDDFVVLDARKGPIYIEEDVQIEPNSHLTGPLFIGKGTRILGAKIRESSIGINCKISGEVTNSIFYQYSNKSHTGFIGHSCIGEWVNLGALTTNSNLKNNYQPITLELGSKKQNTNQQFIGSFIGDHVKTGIGTLLNTGSIIGYGSSIYGEKLHEKFLPPFTWGSADKYEQHTLEKFFQTEESMMKRRKQAMPETQKDVIKILYQS